MESKYKLKKDTIQIWTDGGCRFDSSEGGVKPDSVSGYAVLMKFNGHEKLLGEAELGRTNSYMELKAVLEGLRALRKFGYPVEIYSDSMYVVNPLNKGWYKKWSWNGWKTASGKDVSYTEIWQEIIKFWNSIPEITIHHVPGHSGIRDNERVDDHVNELMDALEEEIRERRI